MRGLWLVATLLLANAPAWSRPAVDWSLTPEGLGPLRIGMSKAAARRALGAAEARNFRNDPLANATFECGEYPSNRFPYLFLLFERGRLSSITIAAPTGSKSSDASRDMTRKAHAVSVRIGSPSQAVTDTFGPSLISEPRPYEESVPLSRELTFWRPGRKLGLVFEIDENGVVDQMRAGTPAIKYMEGCQ